MRYIKNLLFGLFLISNFIKIRTPNIQNITNGIAIDPNLIKSEKLNLIPKKIIPNFKIYCWVKSKPIIMPGLGVNALPIIIPSNIAIRTVEIGLLIVPKISIAKTLLIP